METKIRKYFAEGKFALQTPSIRSFEVSFDFDNLLIYCFSYPEFVELVSDKAADKCVRTLAGLFESLEVEGAETSPRPRMII